MEDEVGRMLEEDERRRRQAAARYDPATGDGCPGNRGELAIGDFPIPVQRVPEDMLQVPLVRKIADRKSIGDFIRKDLGQAAGKDARELVVAQLVRIRCRHDFFFWAAFAARIKDKETGSEVPFMLNRPQRRFAAMLEEDRLAGRPLRAVMLKARQWGGSTVSQLYMAWLQMAVRKGLNSLIIAHQYAATDEIKDMIDRMAAAYPAWLLKPAGTGGAEGLGITAVGRSGSLFRVEGRDCKIKVGTAERPDGCRGGDYSLVHLSEVALWKETDGKKPEDIVRSACSGVLRRPLTMIVYESTANGAGNFFHREYRAAKEGTSLFRPVFVPWFEIPQYSEPPEDREKFARNLLRGRESGGAPTGRAEPGRYLWKLWQEGATLDAVNWYVAERAKYSGHDQMASEYPSDDVEAFVHSGSPVFDAYRVDELARCCREPRAEGDVAADGDQGPAALTNVRFVPSGAGGPMSVWEFPEDGDGGHDIVADRYLAVVDVGGRSAASDWSVVAVFDRLFMADGGKPAVVAQWYGHCDIDILAWKAAQVAAYYGGALLVIESNTLETRDRERDVEGDQSRFILNQIAGVYPNLYARRQPEEDIVRGLPVKYGFHTNPATKPMVVSALVRAVRDGLYVERDRRCADELLAYEKKPNGAYGAAPGNHDDILMTRAIGLHVCFSEMPIPRIIPRAALRPARRPPLTEATI